MESENSVIPSGSVMVTDGMIEAVWEEGSMPSGIDLQGVPIVDTAGTIYPGIIGSTQGVKKLINPAPKAKTSLIIILSLYLPLIPLAITILAHDN